MNTVVLNNERIRMVLTMFRITQGELARASRVSTAMVSLRLAGKKRPSMRLAVALVHGVEKLLTRDRRLDTAFFVGSDQNTIASSHAATEPPLARRRPHR